MRLFMLNLRLVFFLFIAMSLLATPSEGRWPCDRSTKLKIIGGTLGVTAIGGGLALWKPWDDGKKHKPETPQEKQAEETIESPFSGFKISRARLMALKDLSTQEILDYIAKEDKIKVIFLESHIPFQGKAGTEFKYENKGISPDELKAFQNEFTEKDKNKPGGWNDKAKGFAAIYVPPHSKFETGKHPFPETPTILVTKHVDRDALIHEYLHHLYISANRPVKEVSETLMDHRAALMAEANDIQKQVDEATKELYSITNDGKRIDFNIPDVKRVYEKRSMLQLKMYGLSIRMNDDFITDEADALYTQIENSRALKMTPAGRQGTIDVFEAYVNSHVNFANSIVEAKWLERIQEKLQFMSPAVEAEYRKFINTVEESARKHEKFRGYLARVAK